MQVLLRDRFADPHTIEVAINKVWTAASYCQDTIALDRSSQPAALICHFRDGHGRRRHSHRGTAAHY